jgi:hypothetical protein
MSCEPMDRILQTLKVRVPGSTDAILAVELYNVLDQFFRKTNAWQYKQLVQLAHGVDEYPIFPPSNSNLVRVMSMTQNGRPIPAAASGQPGQAVTQRGSLLADAFATDGDPLYHPDKTVSEGAVLRYAIYWPTYITIDIPASQDATKYPLEVTLALSLASKCLESDCGEWDLDEWMYDRYALDWIEGVQAAMMSQIAKPWTNPNMAMHHGKVFRQRMMFAKQEAMRGFTYNAQRWRFPGGWN